MANTQIPFVSCLKSNSERQLRCLLELTHLQPISSICCLVLVFCINCRMLIKIQGGYKLQIKSFKIKLSMWEIFRGYRKASPTTPMISLRPLNRSHTYSSISSSCRTVASPQMPIDLSCKAKPPTDNVLKLKPCEVIREQVKILKAHSSCDTWHYASNKKKKRMRKSVQQMKNNGYMYKSMLSFSEAPRSATCR